MRDHTFTLVISLYILEESFSHFFFKLLHVYIDPTFASLVRMSTFLDTIRLLPHLLMSLLFTDPTIASLVRMSHFFTDPTFASLVRMSTLFTEPTFASLGRMST